ncbi:MAG: transposase [Gemmataceae bacterium]
MPGGREPGFCGATRSGWRRTTTPATATPAEGEGRRWTCPGRTPGKVRFLTYEGTLDAAVSLRFLGKLIRHAKGKIFLIADRLQAHETPEVVAWVAEHADKIEVFYLPPYSPEMDPVEYLDNDLKGAVNGPGLPDSREALLSRVTAFVNTLAAFPRQVIFPTSSRPLRR